MGVPFKPMNNAFGKASRRLLRDAVGHLVGLFIQLAANPHWLRCASSGITGFSRVFTVREMRPVPDGIAQLHEPFEGGVFDYGFVEAQWFDAKIPIKA